MSSRALRKLQKEQEKSGLIHSEDQGDSSDNDEAIPKTTKANAFDMLNAAGLDDEEANATDEDEAGPEIDDKEESVATVLPVDGSKSKKSKKKKKAKKSAKAKTSEDLVHKNAAADEAGLDEIDLALRSLSTNPQHNLTRSLDPSLNEANQQLCRLLAVESRHLNALNEMKRLFGNVVLENEDHSPSPARRRGRGPQQLDLAAALTAQYNPVSHGQGLSGPALRRNFFIQGKEEWPKATGGGLGMELVEKMDDGTVEYRFLHNSMYQDVQRQFESCVESMDPQRMISMLIFNPYHVSTLLQVSEIAKQQGDHSVSGDLLERALFTFGRSVQASFTQALTEGKARLDFRRPENREFWLAAWRYMVNLGQRGTWRAAYEWARLILSLDPEGDPFCISRVIDQLALRGGQPEQFLDLSTCELFRDDVWHDRPGIAISSALAKYRLKKALESRQALAESVNLYPWVFARLFQELSIDHIPKAIWGTSPRSPAEKLDCEIYVHNGKDLWNTPEAISFLVEVVESVSEVNPQKVNDRHITLDEARYALLAGVPSIIDCIPRSFTQQPTSASDPFPPLSNLPSYTVNSEGAEQYSAGPFVPDSSETPSEAGPTQEEGVESDNAPRGPGPQATFFGRATDARAAIDNLINWFSRTAPDADSAPANDENNSGEGNQVMSAERENQNNHLGRNEVTSTEPENHDISHNSSASMAAETGSENDNRESGAVMATEQENGRPPDYAQHHPSDRPQFLGELDDAFERTIPNGHEGLYNNEAYPPDVEEFFGESNPFRPGGPWDQTIRLEDEKREPKFWSSLVQNPRNFLAGKGIQKIKHYFEVHGPDPSWWPSLPEPLKGEDGGNFMLQYYAYVLLGLQDRRDRDFILDHVVPQVAGQGVKELIMKEYGRIVRKTNYQNQGVIGL